jgi:WD40 repeat protein
MYKPIEINKNFKTNDFGNYSVDINKITNDIAISQDCNCYIYSKENFLSQSNTLIPLNFTKSTQIHSNDTIIYNKFTEDGNFLFTSDYDFVINKYNYNINNNIENNNNNIENNNNNNNIEKFKKISTISPPSLKTWKFSFINNKYIAIGNYSLYLYDIVSSSLFKEIPNYNRFIYSSCFISKNNLISVGNHTGSIYFYNLENGNFLKKIEEHCLTVRCLSYNNFDNILFSASDDLHINVIDLNKFKIESPIVGHKEFISQMIYNEEKKLLYTSSFDGCIKVWDLKSKKRCVDTLKKDLNSDGDGNNNENGNGIWDMAVSKNGDFVVGTGDDCVKCFLLK